MLEMDLKIHPPIVLLLCGALAWVISKIFIHPPLINSFVLLSIAAVLLAIGILLGLSAALQFRRVGTTIDPCRPGDTSDLVIDGAYRVTRNPMYLGLLLVLASWVIFLGNVYASISLFIFVYYITSFQIRPEEQVMASKFGEAYSNYCRKVRRWI